MTTLEERLNKLFEDKEDEISNLRNDIVLIYPRAYTKHNKANSSSPFEPSYARPEEPYLPDMPFRMGCETVHDAHHLGLPLYAITPKGYLRIDDHPCYARQRMHGLENRKP